MTMLLARSTARLGMKRFMVESGLWVKACVVLAATVPPVTSTW